MKNYYRFPISALVNLIFKANHLKLYNFFSVRNSLKTLILIVFVFTFSNSSFAQQWISFGNSMEPKPPKITLESSSPTQVVFTCEVYGYYETNIRVDSVDYQKISIPGTGSITQPGHPALPILGQPIAFTGKVTPVISVEIIQQDWRKHTNVYPAPALVDTVDANGNPIVAEIFTLDNTIYNQSTYYPADIVYITDYKKYREQNFFVLALHPIQWLPSLEMLQANIKFRVTVNMGFSTPPKQPEVYYPEMKEFFINYPEHFDEPVKKDYSKSSFVNYYTLSSPADAANIVADYLIITDEQFFDTTNHNDELHRIAAYRANHNGYAVAVLSAQNIMSDAVGFPYERYPQFGDDSLYKYSRRIRECIKAIYDNGNAPHTYDGHLEFVLLVGDALLNYNGTYSPTGVPSSRDPYEWRDELNQTGPPSSKRDYYRYPMDYYFSCITLSPSGIYDDNGDVMVGRFCVENNIQLHNMIEKTINYESNYDFSGWKNKSFFFNGEDLDNTGLLENYLEAQNGFYKYFLPNRISSPYSFNYKDMYLIVEDGYGRDTMIKYLNLGCSYNSYFGHSLRDKVTLRSGLVTSFMDSTYFKNNLHNNNKNGYLLLQSCFAGLFDVSGVCISEFLTRFSDSVGFTGIFSTGVEYSFTSYVTLPANEPQSLMERLVDQQFMRLNHKIGEMQLVSQYKVQLNYPLLTKHEKFNLFGDPCLNLRDEGYFVTKNTILDTVRAVVSDPVHVLAGVTLTIPNNCHVYFENKGSLTIDSGAYVQFQDTAYFHGREMYNSLTINGGVKIKQNTPPTIYFSCPDGMSCNGIVIDNPQLNVTFRKLNLYHVPLTVNKVGEFHVLSTPGNRSKINRDPIFFYGTKLEIQNTDFINGSGFLCINESGNAGDLNINNCRFTPTSTQSTNQSDLININGYANYSICNDSIIFNCGDAIGIYNSGLTGNTYNISNNKIIFNGATYYQNNGLRFYASKAAVSNNYITNCKHGISVYNNSVVTITGNSSAANASQTQQIVNNVDEQIYVLDKTCFPSLLRYNYITNQTANPLIRCGGTLIPANSLNVKCNNWGSGFNPATDLLPDGKYTYTPQWTFGSVCNPGMLAGSVSGDLFNNINNASPVDEDFYEQLDNFTQAAFNEYNVSNHSAYLSKIQRFAGDAKNDILHSRAQFICNNLLLKQGSYNELLQHYSNHILHPVDLADSVYSLIEKERIDQLPLMLNDTGITSLPYKINKSRQLNVRNTELLNLLYRSPEELKAIQDNQYFDFILFPSPAHDILYIKIIGLQVEQLSLSIYDLSGRQLLNTTPTDASDDLNVNISSLSPGCYILKAFEGHKIIYTSKFIKQ